MEHKHFTTGILIVLSIFLSACRPSQGELDATSTQGAADNFATQTALAATATATFTPSQTDTPTSLMNNPRVSSPTPSLSSISLTLADLPPGFVANDEKASDLEDSYPEGEASVVQFENYQDRQTIKSTVFIIHIEPAAFDQDMTHTLHLFAAGLAGSVNYEDIPNLDDLGEARTGVTTVNGHGMRWDLVEFRRGEIAVLLFMFYPDGDQPARPIGDLASLLDERISNYQGLTTP